MKNETQMMKIDENAYTQIKEEYDAAVKKKRKKVVYNGVGIDVGDLKHLLSFMKGHLKL